MVSCQEGRLPASPEPILNNQIGRGPSFPTLTVPSQEPPQRNTLRLTKRPLYFCYRDSDTGKSESKGQDPGGRVDVQNGNLT